MLKCDTDQTINITYLDASLEEVWNAVTTPQGMNSYLTYSAEKTGDPNNIKEGDKYKLWYGDIVNEAIVTACIPYRTFAVADSYESIKPNGEPDFFHVQTTFYLEKTDNMVKLTLIVKGFSSDTYGQWFRECLEMGWRRSLMSLKLVLELGMDLRPELFSYPRLGIVNCTLNQEQRKECGLKDLQGNYLMEVFPNSPAHEAGLRKGDVIISLDSELTPNYSDFVRILSSFNDVNRHVKIQFFRDGELLETLTPLTISEVFTGIVDPEKDTYEGIRLKREDLARQRSASGSLWKNEK
ncbi:MAG: PDZ domain-containing protein [Bacillota bacterium]